MIGMTRPRLLIIGLPVANAAVWIAVSLLIGSPIVLLAVMTSVATSPWFIRGLLQK